MSLIRPSLVRPFPALRPAPGRAPEVIAPPYDVLNTAEARVLAVADAFQRVTDWHKRHPVL